MTDAWVRGAKPVDGKRTDFQDDNEPALWLRVLPASKRGRRASVLRTFYYRGSVNGADVLMRIGVHPAKSLAAARKEAASFKARFKTEPNWRERVSAEAAAAAAAEDMRRRRCITVEALIEEFLRHERGRIRGAENGKKVPGRLLDATTVDWHTHVLRKHVASTFGTFSVDEVKPADVAALVYGLGQKGKVKTANVVRRLVSQVFEFARGQLQIEITNPAAHIERFTEEPRTRCPSDDEIRALDLALAHPNCLLSKGASSALRVALRTGQRIGEVVSAHDDEFNFDALLWVVPGSRTKSGKPHPVPIVAQVGDLIREAQQQRPGQHNGFVFASSQKEGAPITKLACSQGMARLCRRLEIVPVCPHDFRRVARSLLGREWLDVNPMHAELILSHAVGSRLQQIYDRHDYVRERRKALVALNRELDRIISGQPVETEDGVLRLRA